MTQFCPRRCKSNSLRGGPRKAFQRRRTWLARPPASCSSLSFFPFLQPTSEFFDEISNLLTYVSHCQWLFLSHAAQHHLYTIQDMKYFPFSRFPQSYSRYPRWKTISLVWKWPFTQTTAKTGEATFIIAVGGCLKDLRFDRTIWSLVLG